MSETIAVFIDGDNFNYKNIGIAIQEIKKHGRIISCRVYGDWSKEAVKGWLSTTKKFGIEEVQCSIISRKNSTDIRMCVDIMKYLYTLETISLYYLLTSDSDFRHLIPEIKYRNKKVYCIGNSNSNDSLKCSCDLFTKIEVLINEEWEEEDNKSIKKQKFIKELSKRKKKKIYRIIMELLSDKEHINMGWINSELQRRIAFDYREYDCDTFSKFIIKHFKDVIYVNKNSTCILRS